MLNIESKFPHSEVLEVSVVPPSETVGELAQGANRTATTIYTFPIPAGSDVKDFRITFRDWRPTFDDDRRTLPEVFATKASLLGDIVGWTSVDEVFNGSMWRKHNRTYAVDNTTYGYSIYVSITSTEINLIFQGTHVGNTNAYGGWENLEINFTGVDQVANSREIEIQEITGTYYPTSADNQLQNITTGLDMTDPNAVVRLQIQREFSQHTVYVYREQHLTQRSAHNFISESAPVTVNFHNIFDPVNGTIRNGVVTASSRDTIVRVDVLVPKKVKVLV